MRFVKPSLDRVFGGSLLQIVSCLDCEHESVCFEPFLDLSLSIPRSNSTFTQSKNGNNGNKEKTVSKNQQKKAKKQQKKVSEIVVERTLKGIVLRFQNYTIGFFSELIKFLN